MPKYALIDDRIGNYDEGMKPKRLQLSTLDIARITAVAAVSLLPSATYRDELPTVLIVVMSLILFGLLLPASFGKWRTTGGMFVVIVVLLILIERFFPGPGSVGPAARQNACLNTVRQLSIGIANYEAVNGPLPACVVDDHGKPMHSWRVLILPYVEEFMLYEDYDFSKPWDSPENQSLQMPEWFRCPADSGSSEATTTYVAVTGSGTVWDRSAGSFESRIRIVESLADRQHWLDPTSPSLEQVLGRSMPFETPHISGEVIASFTDGSVSAIPKSTKVSAWRKMFTRK